MRLEFWAALLDLIGLTVLLSHDIEILKFVENFAYKFPPLKRLRAIDQQIQDGLKTFVYDSPEIEEERLLQSFQGSVASDFVKQFPKLKDQSIPAEVDACACYVAPSTSHILEIFIWPSPKGQFTPMLADPMLDTDLNNWNPKEETKYDLHHWIHFDGDRFNLALVRNNCSQSIDEMRPKQCDEFTPTER